MLQNDYAKFEKPIDLILQAIIAMETKDKELEKDIDCFHKCLLDKLNAKIALEVKIEKWKKVAETFRFKKNKF